MQIMDKSTFLKNYRSKHPEIWVYVIFEILFDIIGTIIIAVNVKKIIEYHSHREETKLIFLIFLGIFFWILGLVFLCLIKSVESNGNKEYERYLISCSAYQTPNTFNTWVCPRCGSYNDNRKLLCSRCSEKKPYVVKRQGNGFTQNNNISNTDSWICPNCGRQNQNYVGTCGCGVVKPK